MSKSMLNLVLVGAHMSGMPLNHQLTNIGANMVRACKTAPVYKMYSLAGLRPSLIRQGKEAPCGGFAFDVEVWAVPIEKFG